MKKSHLSLFLTVHFRLKVGFFGRFCHLNTNKNNYEDGSIDKQVFMLQSPKHIETTM